MGFKKPPVVEAWIEFKFALTDEVSTWDEQTAKVLMQRCYPAFQAVTFFKSTQIEVKLKDGKPEFTDSKEFFERIKAFSPDRDRCIQAGRDAFVFNQLKKDTWRGYERMRDAALEAADKYMGFRDLHEFTSIALHYRDVVAVPRARKSGISLGDWFRIYPEVPEDTFGTMSGFNFTVHLPELCEGARAVVSVQSVPPDSYEVTDYKFSIDWHVISADNKVREIEAARGWLDSAHLALRSTFERAFTPACLQLFEPVEGD